MNAFDKIIGYDDIKAELACFADVIKNQEKYLKLGVTLPRGLLLSGNPGLGKTLMANCFITEAGCKAFTVRKEKPNGDFVNYIKETFDKAKKETPSIVFLDDMDKFANEDASHRNAEEYVAVQSCIDECKGHDVFVLATVNDKFCLPDSLIRAGRFDKMISIDVPNEKYSEHIIKHFLRRKQIMDDVDVNELVRLMEGQSCAKLETVINEAGIYAGFDGRERITHGDIIKAIMRMLFDSPECINPSDDADTRKIAVHEAGHAVVAEVLNPGSVTLTSVCRHTGCTEGITKLYTPKGYFLSKKLQENNILSGLGGKAAIEILYGVADVGCNSDMGKVFNLVSEFVDPDCTLGFDMFEGRNSSQYLLERKDRMIASEVARYYRSARQILIENREFLDAMIEALVEHKTVTFREIQNIRERHLKCA
ncbi:AAA family ATPase [Schwartzia succinivorans]|jgi:cell division protease FtsH|uniref:Cell division protease FtsH n=1 Tax=Schwartzia succinivorans DSM 10502 TaxID=1123243 RepID=A0A1M4VVT3_9FIRM|nr:AAA family ATPase [Schwartzia succinivorans]SHE72973.1 cell division protease FtsH [Schwartzia succinivorans DSM 10502]